jgi:hypothetical protein
MRIIEKLIESIRKTGTYNTDTQTAPVCILLGDTSKAANEKEID